MQSKVEGCKSMLNDGYKRGLLTLRLSMLALYMHIMLQFSIEQKRKYALSNWEEEAG